MQQVVLNLRGRVRGRAAFKDAAALQVVRHPLYLGFIIAFWATPAMTTGHLLFAAVTTAYILVAVCPRGARPDGTLR